MKRKLADWGDMVFGVVIGITLTMAVLAAVNYVYGWQRVGVWQRALDGRQAEVLEGLMLEQVSRAGESMADGSPGDLSGRMALAVFPALYEHYLSYARNLLESDRVEEFNQLRQVTGFAHLELSGADLAGLDLRGANFGGAILDRSNLQRAFLDQSSFFMASLRGADLSAARVSGASFAQADLTGARLNGILGADVDFGDAVLVSASLTAVTGLEGARFAGAVMAESNLQGSSFPGAVFNGADLTMASAVDCDFSRAASLEVVMLQGAILAGARINPDVSSRLWLENAEGLSESVLVELRKRDCVDRPESLLRLADPRIVTGFRAQLETDPDIPTEQRRKVLLDLLRQYWMQ